MSPDKRTKIGSSKKTTTKKIKNLKESNQSGYIINHHGSPIKNKGLQIDPMSSP